MARYDQCYGECTVDCGHCKGAGPPQYVVREREGWVQMFSEADKTDGVVRWRSNGHVVPRDITHHWGHVGLLTQAEVLQTDVAREADQQAFFAAYRQARAERTPEEVAADQAELLAAFGPGVNVVNVITGERTAL